MPSKAWGSCNNSYEKIYKYLKPSNTQGTGLLHSNFASQMMIPPTHCHSGWHASGNHLISQPTISTFTFSRVMLTSTAQSQHATMSKPFNLTGSGRPRLLTGYGNTLEA